MIVYLSVCGLYVRDLGRDRAVHPVVVLKDGCALDANAPALRRGVEIGMRRTACKAIVPEAELLFWRADDHRQSQAAWLDVCCRHTGVVEPGAQHEAFVDLSAHPRPEDVLDRMVQDLVVAGFPVRWGVARVKWLARLAAHEDAGWRAWTDPAGFLRDLPVDRLDVVPHEHRERLALLGYGCIGQVAHLPLERLQEAFGAEGLRIHRAARGGLSEAVRPLYPPRRALARFRFESPVHQAEAVDVGLARLACQLARRLRAEDLQGTRLVLEAETEGGLLRAERDFSKPMHSEGSVLFALRLMLRSVPLRKPVEALAAEIPALRPASRRQPSLYRAGERLAGRECESLLDPLRAKFGEGSVRLASQIEQPRSRLVLRAWREGLGWI